MIDNCMSEDILWCDFLLPHIVLENVELCTVSSESILVYTYLWFSVHYSSKFNTEGCTRWIVQVTEVLVAKDAALVESWVTTLSYSFAASNAIRVGLTSRASKTITGKSTFGASCRWTVWRWGGAKITWSPSHHSRWSPSGSSSSSYRGYYFFPMYKFVNVYRIVPKHICLFVGLLVFFWSFVLWMSLQKIFNESIETRISLSSCDFFPTLGTMICFGFDKTC